MGPDLLKGRDLQQVLSDGARLRVWYEEEGAHGPTRVCYDGMVTSYNPSLGLRVWFDGFSASEQEWVNEGDEWDWEEPSNVPSPAAADYTAVRLKMRSSAGTTQIFRLPSASPGVTVTSSSSLSLSSSESSPSKFNKKARLLRAGMGMASSSATNVAEAGPSSDDRAGTSAVTSSSVAEGSVPPRARAAATRAPPEMRATAAAEASTRGAAPSMAPPKRWAHRPYEGQWLTYYLRMSYTHAQPRGCRS